MPQNRVKYFLHLIAFLLAQHRCRIGKRSMKCSVTTSSVLDRSCAGQHGRDAAGKRSAGSRPLRRAGVVLQRRLFDIERFYKVDTARAAECTGSGLGLSIIKRLSSVTAERSM